MCRRALGCEWGENRGRDPARTGAARQKAPTPPESEDLSAVARAMASAMEVDTPQAAHSKMDVEGESAKPAESKSAKPDVRP